MSQFRVIASVDEDDFSSGDKLLQCVPWALCHVFSMETAATDVVWPLCLRVPRLLYGPKSLPSEAGALAALSAYYQGLLEGFPTTISQDEEV